MEGVSRAVVSGCTGHLVVFVRLFTGLFHVDHAVLTATLVARVLVGCGCRDDSWIGCSGIALIASLAHGAGLGTSLRVEARVANDAGAHASMRAILTSFAGRARLGAFGPCCVRRVSTLAGAWIGGEGTCWAGNRLDLLFHAPVTLRAW